MVERLGTSVRYEVAHGGSEMGKKILTRRYPAWLAFLALALVFGVSHGQFRLYYFTQNQYFFYGLKNAGFGLLRGDWLAHTSDSWPLFSLLVQVTYRFLDQRLFYLYYILLLGVYAYSLIGIASSVSGIAASRAKYAVYLVLFTALHSPAFVRVQEAVLRLDLSQELLEGVASQRIIWDMLTPSAFGAFLLLSIYLFLRERPWLSVFSAVVAAAFHPIGYLPSAGVLVFSYLVIMARRGEDFKRILGLAVYALLLVSPILGNQYLGFRPTSPEIWRRAQEIVAEFRLFHNAIPARWVGDLYVRIPVVLAALYLIRRHELYVMVLLSFVAAAGLTVVQVLSHNEALGVLSPWRISVFLVPLCTAVVLASVVSWLVDGIERRFPRGRRVMMGLSACALIVLVLAGAVVTARRWHSWFGFEKVSVLRFVRAQKSPADTYLIPVEWRNFRLFTGAPAFVDYRFSPYNDVAVLEWYKRVRLAESFYAADKDGRCRTAREISAAYGVTHVVVNGGDADACNGWTLVFREGSDRLYQITR